LEECIVKHIVEYGIFKEGYRGRWITSNNFKSL